MLYRVSNILHEEESCTPLTKIAEECRTRKTTPRHMRSAHTEQVS